MTTLRQKIGQMLVMGFDGTRIEPGSEIWQWLSRDGLGGVLLCDYDIGKRRCGRNLVDVLQIQDLTQQLQDRAKAFNEELPLFIAIDYEGGSIDALKKIDDCMPTFSATQFARLPEKEQALQADLMAETLKILGFNVNFAPVVDLNLNDRQGIIGKLDRSYSADPREVIRHASTFVKGFTDYDILCCYKHFPGHGSATGDTHEGFVDVSDTFQASELEPYAVLLKNQPFAMVMTAHVINRKLDPQGLPATLSHSILTGLLREKMGFEGLIISDDLQMQAITNHYKLNDSLALTINAGADMIIFANQFASITPTEIIDRIEGLILERIVSASRIEQAFQRIKRVKQTIRTAVLPGKIELL